MRKGFVYTLEAVIASSLVLTVSLFVIPNTVSDPETDFGAVEEGMLSLQDRDKLGNSTDKIEDEVEVFVPQNYNLTARIHSINKTREKINSEEEFELKQGYKNLILWVHTDDSFDITYREDNVFSSSSTGYSEVELSRESGYLNFTGNPDLTFEVQRHYSEGTAPDSNTVISRNLIDGGEREIQVMMWQ